MRRAQDPVDRRGRDCGRTFILGPVARGPICLKRSCTREEEAGTRSAARLTRRTAQSGVDEDAPRARAPTPRSAGCGSRACCLVLCQPKGHARPGCGSTSQSRCRTCRASTSHLRGAASLSEVSTGVSAAPARCRCPPASPLHLWHGPKGGLLDGGNVPRWSAAVDLMAPGDLDQTL